MSEGDMKKAFFIILIAFLSNYAQNCGDTISLKGNWFIGYKYSYHCSDYQNISGLFSLKQDFKDIISTNLNAKREINVAISYSVIGTVLGCVGAGIAGWHLADLTYGKKVDSWVWYTSISLLGVGITFNIFGTSHMLKSVKIFNKFKS
jgi:hypothetical protein